MLHATCGVAFAMTAASLVPQRQAFTHPQPQILITNDSDRAWDGIVPVSIPWPRGMHADLQRVAIAGESSPCEPLIRWSDGSVCVVCAWPRLRLGPGSELRLDVRPLDGSHVEVSELDYGLFADDLPMRTVVEDPWGERFLARFVPDPSAGPGGWIRRGRVGVRRFRSAHRNATGSFLGLRAYLVAFAGEHRAELTVLLDNASLDARAALGPVRFRRFALDTTARLLVLPRWGDENLLESPAPARSGADGFVHTLLGPSDQLYLGDRTAKSYRFTLIDHAADPTEVGGPRPIAIPTAAWTRATRAFGAHGGPAPMVSAKVRPEALGIERAWRQSARFGPFGDFGDPADAAANGTPRNGPSALHDVVRCGSATLLRIAEGKVLQHTLRPTPGCAPRLPEHTAELRQGLSPRTIQRPHGFTALDYEHFSVDLLYDYYWLTADPLAHDEIVRMAGGLKPLLDGLPFMTARGEGWCMQAAVLARRATGDDALLKWVRVRFGDTVLPRMGKDAQPFAIQQPPHDLAFGAMSEPFEAPWQMAALVHGLHALWSETGDLRASAAAIRSAHLMATIGWAEDVGPKYLYSAVDPRRYRLPVGFGPLEGTAWMQVGAFVLAGEMLDAVGSDNESWVDRSLLASRADSLVAGQLDEVGASRNPWFQIYLDRHR